QTGGLDYRPGPGRWRRRRPRRCAGSTLTSRPLQEVLHRPGFGSCVVHLVREFERPRQVANFRSADPMGVFDSPFYFVIKLFAYCVWCLIGLRWFQPGARLLVAKAVRFGALRLFMGLFFGILIYFLSRA